MKKLNIGCGKLWDLYSEYEGLDIIDFGQTYVMDILDFLAGGVPKIQYANLFDEVMANHFLEHFSQDQLQIIFSGVHGLLKPDGIFKFVVPHMSKERSWVLPHKTFWNEVTVRWLGEKDVNEVYRFGKWKIVEVVTNAREDIHALLEKEGGGCNDT